MNVVGTRLREAMADRGIDQSALAHEIGVTQGAISLILRGKTRQSKYLVDIAIFLGVNYEWLAGRSDEKTPMYEEVAAKVTRDDLALIAEIRGLPSVERAGLRMLIANRHARRELPTRTVLISIFESILAATPTRDAATLARALADKLPEALAVAMDKV